MQLRSAAVRSSLVAMLVALLVPATAAMGDHVETRGTASACADAPEDGFSDTGNDGSVFEEAVDCISWYAITSGTSQTTYGPRENIRRGQMARMIAQSMRQSLTRFAEPGDDVNHFSDDEGNQFEPDIDFVAEHGVVRGKTTTSYDPGGFVTRAQMATFLVNQLEAIGVTIPAPTTDYFDDDNDSRHEGNINKLASVGLASGRTHRGFEPTEHVTRQQMALFISRDLAELVDRGFMVPPNQRVAVAEDGEHTKAVVATVARAANSFTTSADDEEHGSERFWYDDNDVFQDPDGGDITLAEFDGLLTGPVGDTEADVVSVTYAHDPDEESTFEVVTDNVPPPTDATAFAGDHDGDGDSNDVIVSWTASAQPHVVYDVFRDDDAGGIAIVSPADTEVASDVTVTSVLLEDEPDGDWSYYVIAESPATGSTSSESTTEEVTVPASTAGTAGRPVAVLAIQSGADGDQGAADDGDIWRIAFDQPLADIEDGDSLTVVEGSDATQDTGEGRATVEHSPPPFEGFPSQPGDATFSLNSESMTLNGTTYSAGRVLTVELHADLNDSDGNVLTYPLTISYSVGLTDEDGEPVNWPGSNDRRIEADTSLPFIVDADGDINGSDPDKITVVYSEDVTCSSTTQLGDDDPEDQFRYDRDTSVSGDEVQATDVDCDGDNTIVVTFPDGVFDPGAPRDAILYDQSEDTPDVRVQDNVGNDARSPDSEGVDG